MSSMKEMAIREYISQIDFNNVDDNDSTKYNIILVAWQFCVTWKSALGKC